MTTRKKYPEDGITNHVRFKTAVEKHKRKKLNPVIVNSLKKI